ncbi:MAG TPA: DUF2169 domain-containing protein [Enhygromyxa sp.]|nr:DUF2169 domain-containing protein [Enhygromyxa sp.]
MLTLVNETDHAADLVRLMLDGETAAAVVIVKSTYDLDRGHASLSARQRPVLRKPASEEGITLEPETVLGKAAVDVLAIGAAAGDARTRISSVAVQIGAWSSTALVFGDRTWRRSLRRWSATEPQPFSAIPISWATAFGGVARFRGAPLPHAANPAGKGYLVDVDEHGEGAPLPNIEDPDDRLDHPGQLVRPLSFAPLPSSSALRVDAARDDSKPAGVTKAIFNVAHPRHRLAELHGGERCEARGWVGMPAEAFELPRERFIVEVRIDARRHEYEPRIDTVMLLPAKRQLVVVRRSTFTYPYIRTTTRSARLRLGS